MPTEAATLTRVQALHPDFATVTADDIGAVWDEVVARVSATKVKKPEQAYALMAAHLVAGSPFGSNGSGVGLTVASSRSSQLSVSAFLPPGVSTLDVGDLGRTCWGIRLYALMQASPRVVAPRMYLG